MQLQSFQILVFAIFIFWILGISIFFLKKTSSLKAIGLSLIFIGSCILIGYIIYLWNHLGRPPIKTLGETRLWYSLFLSIIGIITFLRWKLKWIVLYTTFMSMLVLVIDLLKPSTFDQTLMPALQSPWFIPHVIVYMIAYAFLALAALTAIQGIIDVYNKNYQENTLKAADNIVYIGFAFLTFGLLFGALWAKEAWGSYWTWDPKETWAFITWMCYLIYIHLRHQHPKSQLTPLWILAFSFVILLICWFGVNYLPSAANSVHVYGS
ncbi:MAG: cytochrome C assembly protein [Ignavibacteria bacterium GWF2_33_9]|nr:MAG: cytochrome C assembly protein [Ignavibacteria bacterium GWF2_33_9]